ncbi:hypothetical protein JIY74_33470 [Vibrio harveyi]|nr:hypothetical protein [Vibrio harveyi]
MSKMFYKAKKFNKPLNG